MVSRWRKLISTVVLETESFQTNPRIHMDVPPPFPPLRGPENSSKISKTHPKSLWENGSGGSELIIYIIRPAKRLNALGVIILDGALPDW